MFVDNAEKRQKWMLRYFTFINILFAFEFGFIKFKSARNKVIVKVIGFIQASAIFVLCFLSYYKSANYILLVYRLGHLVKYVCYVMSCMVPETGALVSFHPVLSDIDSKLGVSGANYRVEIKLFVAFIILISLSMAPHIYYSAYLIGSFSDTLVPFLMVAIYSIPVCALDIVVLTYWYVLYSVLCRLKKFTKVLRTSLDMCKMQRIYMSLTDLVLMAKKRLDLIYFLTLIFNVPYLLFAIFYWVYSMLSTEQESGANYTTLYLNTFKAMALVLSPAFLSEQCGFEADKIKVELHDRLLQERGSQQIQETTRFIEFVNVQPLKLSVYKVIPLDSSLMFITIDFCMNYLIVILQLTHLF